MLKESDIKKLIKNFNKYGKGMRPDGVYVIREDILYSAIINDIHGTPGVFRVKFIDTMANKAFAMLDGHTMITGADFNKILSGTGLKISFNDYNIISKIENKTDVWQNESHSSVEKSIMSKYSVYANYLKEIDYTIEFPDSVISELIETKTFILNICDYLDFPGIDILKISNKSLKNFSKTTHSIHVDVSKQIGDTRVVRFVVVDDIAETESIYGLLVE